MRVLGISPLDKDVTVSFMEDGEIVFACGEERLSRVKLQDGFPDRAIDMGLAFTGWESNSIDQVAYSFFDGTEETRLMRKAMERDDAVHTKGSTAESLSLLNQAQKREQTRRSNNAGGALPAIPGLKPEHEYAPRKSWYKRQLYDLSRLSPRLDHWLHQRGFQQWIEIASADHELRTRQLEEGLRKRGWLDRLKRYNHHLCHAANAYYFSGFDKALAMSFDGYGSGNCGAVYLASPDGLKCLHEFSFPNSLGQFYEYVTSALGFRPGRHEGKIVGLAAYGDPQLLAPTLLARFTGMEQGDIQIRGAVNYYLSRLLSQTFSKRDMAAAYQYVLEEVVKQIAEFWVNQTGCQDICLSGGVNANVKLNQRIHERKGVTRVFVYPNMGDGGCATGAAVLAFQSKPRNVLSNAYLGPGYSDDEIEQALNNAKLSFQRHDEIESEIAKQLANNRIVARFNGRMEYGPRALGNRSILYPAQEPEVNLWLNHQLGRTEFMPFAPVALASEADSLFQGMEGARKTAEFMTITFDCTQRMKDLCPAAVHIDGTARPQLVTSESNPSLFKVLMAYQELTEIPAIINTSFNMHEEPIVCSPEDAIRAFLEGRIDILAIGPFLVPHPQLEVIQQERSASESLA